MAEKTQKMMTRRRRWLRRLFFTVLFSPVWLFLLSNILLNSSWAKAKVEARLTQASQLPWEVGTMNWTPWGGLHLHDVGVPSEEGGAYCAIETITIKPYWGEWMRGRKSLREVTVIAPKVDMPASLFVGWLGQAGMPAKGPEGSEASVAKPQPAEQPPSEPPTQPKGGAEKPRQREPQQGQPSKPTPQPAPEEEVKRPPAGMPFWLRVRDGEIKLTGKGGSLLEVEAFKVDLPLLGEDVDGGVSLSKILVKGETVAESINVPISWERPVLSVAPAEGEWEEVRFRYAAQLTRFRGNSLLNVVFEVPRQSLHAKEALQEVMGEVSVEELEFGFRWRGVLEAPASWQGVAALRASGLRCRELHRGNDVEFDEVMMSASLSSAGVRVVDARAVGEDVALLGNGFINRNFQCLGVMRVVTSPELRNWIWSLHSGAGLFNVDGRVFSVLDTPDRWFVDAYVFGPIQEPALKMGERGQPQSLKETLQRLKLFVQSEAAEDLGGAPSLND